MAPDKGLTLPAIPINTPEIHVEPNCKLGLAHPFTVHLSPLGSFRATHRFPTEAPRTEPPRTEPRTGALSSRRISAYGAAGGKGAQNHLSRAHGIFLSAVFFLSRGEPVYILVGQQGQDACPGVSGASGTGAPGATAGGGESPRSRSISPWCHPGEPREPARLSGRVWGACDDRWDRKGPRLETLGRRGRGWRGRHLHLPGRCTGCCRLDPQLGVPGSSLPLGSRGLGPGRGP